MVLALWHHVRLSSSWHLLSPGIFWARLRLFFTTCRIVDREEQVTCLKRADLSLYIYIYIYAFSRRFYPKRLTLHSSYSFTFYQLLLSLGIEPMILALLAPCSTIWATGKPVCYRNMLQNVTETTKEIFLYTGFEYICGVLRLCAQNTLTVLLFTCNSPKTVVFLKHFSPVLVSHR